MLTMSQKQFEQLGADQKQRFIAQLMERLRLDLPVQTKPLDDQALRELIEDGSRHAETYGLFSEAHVRVYCAMMLRHGRDFDADPKLPWAGDILNDETLAPRDKVARLDGVQVFLDRSPPT